MESWGFAAFAGPVRSGVDVASLVGAFAGPSRRGGASAAVPSWLEAGCVAGPPRSGRSPPSSGIAKAREPPARASTAASERPQLRRKRRRGRASGLRMALLEAGTSIFLAGRGMAGSRWPRYPNPAGRLRSLGVGSHFHLEQRRCLSSTVIRNRPDKGETTRSPADCRSVTSLSGLSVSNFFQLLDFVLESDSGSWIKIRSLECFGGPIEGHGGI